MSSQPQPADVNNYSDFLKEAGWGDADIQPLNADMGNRLYFKAMKEDKTALLMDMSAVDKEESHDTYLSIDSYLARIGVRVPEIYYSNAACQCSLIEMFGEQSFGDAFHAGTDPKKIYQTATDVLKTIKTEVQANDLKLIRYKDSRPWKNLPQFVDYYAPAVTGQEGTDNLHVKFQEVWDSIESLLPSCPKTFCHADYHLENLMWRPDSEEGYGLIDFQDAFWGPQPYDLLNLLEDARVSVPDDIKSAMKDRYCEGMGTLERAVFDDWYTVLSAQFHCRVLGLFIKFSQETKTNKFLAHIPRLQGYMRKNLENPVLKPLKDWLTDHRVSFDININS